MNLLKIPYRPLRGGTGIVPSSTRRWATAGLFAQGHGRRWLLTAAHSIGPLDPGDRLAIHQGTWGQQGAEIAIVTASDILLDLPLDVAAIPVADALIIRPEIVGLGQWAPPVAAGVGAEVVKVGVGTGFVRGQVSAVNGSHLRISALPDYPRQYSLAESGDSGAAWLLWPSMNVVALHVGQAAGGEALAVSAVDFLAHLNLTV